MCEVKVKLKPSADMQIASVMTLETLDDSGLRPGDTVQVVAKAVNVLLNQGMKKPQQNPAGAFNTNVSGTYLRAALSAARAEARAGERPAPTANEDRPPGNSVAFNAGC